MRSIITSEVYEPVLPGRQHHGQSRPLHIGQSSQLRVRHSCSLRVREHADLPLVEHHLQDAARADQAPRQRPSRPDLVNRTSALVWRLTANLSGGIIEIATGMTPSICSLTKADIAMSGRPAGGRGGKDISIRARFFALSYYLTTSTCQDSNFNENICSP